MNSKTSAPPRSRRGFRGVALVADPNEDYGREVEWVLTRAGFAVVRTREVGRAIIYVEREIQGGRRESVPDLLVTTLDAADDRQASVEALMRVASELPVVVTTASESGTTEIRGGGASATVVERSSGADALRKVLAEAGREWLARSRSGISS